MKNKIVLSILRVFVGKRFSIFYFILFLYYVIFFFLPEITLLLNSCFLIFATFFSFLSLQLSATFFSNVQFLFIEIILFVVFIFTFFCELYLVQFAYNKYHVNYLICFILPALIFVTYLLLIELSILENVNEVLFFNSTFVFGYFVIFAKICILLLMIIIFILSLNYFDFEKFQIFEYPLLLLISMIGMFLLVASADFFVFYLLLELVSFCFYILASLKRYSNLAIEAALKYFILGSFSSAILLFGVSLLYGFFGTTNFFEIFILVFSLDLFVDNYFAFFLCLLFIAVGLLFKLAVVPFHF
jgi:NADH:ubiquinone oxidoreductase subunit 2 (subunit N)